MPRPSNFEKKQREDMDKLTDSMFRFIQKFPPPNFNLTYFQLCSQVGRLDGMIECLEKYSPNPDLIENDAIKENVVDES